jgi:anti-sigma regulatory factor (Ser/Thr protein kinase)
VTFSLRIEADTDGLAHAQQALREYLSGIGASERATYDAELALDELVTNIIEHGYGREAVERPIDLAASACEDEIALTIEDDGQPFDPIGAPDPVPATSLEHVRIGGLGIHLVRKAADALEYTRVSDRNRVVVKIRRR